MTVARTDPQEPELPGTPSPTPPSPLASPAADTAADEAPGEALPSASSVTEDPGVAPAEEGPRKPRSEEPPPPPVPAERLEGAVEALLLASSEALSVERIRDALGLPSTVHVREAIAAIRARWQAANLAVEVQDVAGGHRVVTRPEYAEYVRRLWRRAASDRLS